jgi:oligopeptidase B
VAQEDDERFYLDVRRSRSGGYVFITAESAITSEVWAIPADDPTQPPRSVMPRTPGVEYSVDHRGGVFWVVSNDEAPDGKVLTLPVDGGPATEVVPHEPGVKRSYPDCFADHVVVWGRRGGLPAALIIPEVGEAHYLGLPESVYQLGPEKNYEFDTTALRYRYESPVTPLGVYDHDVVTGEQTLLKQTPVLDGYDPADYVALREWAIAADESPVPISLVYRRDTAIDGSAPLVVYAYGAYEASMPASFSIPRLSLLDRGAVYAIAHVRGGGEMGRRWYEGGKMANKENTFTDLLNATDHLVAAGYGDPRRLAARGASAGGLTVGAAMSMRPDLYTAVVVRVPFVDVINTMLDESLPLTVVEWEEWGNPNDPEQYKWLRGYAPYENVAATKQPALLVTAGLNDPRVSYWEPAKWVAKLRTEVTGDNPILLKTEMGAGHFARSGRYDSWRDEAFNLAFLLTHLGAG